MAEMFGADDLQRLAQLARLALTADEQELFVRQLADILAYARQVQDVDTAGVPPMSHPAAATSPMRDDAAVGSLPRETALSSAPDADSAAGMFKVPRVLG